MLAIINLLILLNLLYSIFMRKYLLLTLLWLYGSWALAQLPFLQQSGTLIVEENTGIPVFLKGTNLGNWFIQEGFMTTHRADVYQTQSDIKRMLKDEKGATASQIEDFYSDWRHHFIRKADIDYIASKGMNCIRVPLHYELFIPDEIRALRNEVIYASEAQRNAKYEAYKETLANWANDPNFATDPAIIGFGYINDLIDWCKANHMYIILDMHAVPGTQGSKEPIADRLHTTLPAKDLYRDKRNEDALVAIWKSISDIYKNESTIAMYELINEPNDVKSNVPNLRGIYNRLINTIRKNNDDHLILLQGDEFGNNYKSLEPTQFSDFGANLVYSTHRYNTDSYALPANTYSTNDQNSDHIAHLGNAIAFRDKYQVPIFCGETGLNDNYEWAADNIKALNKAGIGWTVWTYKHHRDGTQNTGRGGLRCMAKIPGPWVNDGPSKFSEIIHNIQFSNIVENPHQEYWDGIMAETNIIPSNLIITLKGHNNRYVSGENGTTTMRCNIEVPQDNEKFRVEYVNGNQVFLRALSHHAYNKGAYIVADDENGMVASKEEPDLSDTFIWEIVGSNRVRLKNSNGKYVSVAQDKNDLLTVKEGEAGDRETFIWQISSHSEAPLHEVVEHTLINKAQHYEMRGMLILPNPAHNMLNIRLSELPGNFRGGEVKVVSIRGKIIYQNSLSSALDKTIRCDDWPNGIYIVSVKNGNSIYKDKVVISQ